MWFTCWCVSHLLTPIHRSLLVAIDHSRPYVERAIIFKHVSNYGNMKINYALILHRVKVNFLINTNTRRDEVLIHRCLLGHARLTHSHLLLNKPAPVCERCQHSLTVKHILLKYNNVQQIRRSLYQSNSLKHLLHHILLIASYNYYVNPIYIMNYSILTVNQLWISSTIRAST